MIARNPGNERGHQRGGQLSDGQHTKDNDQQQDYSTIPPYGMQGQAANIPAELRALPNWLLFAVAPDTKTGGLTKKPTGATSNDPDTWRSFADIAGRRKSGRMLGFALRAADRIWLADFDHCVDKQTGALRSWAIPHIAPFLGRTYVEISASKDGLHVWGKGNKPSAMRSSQDMPDGGKIEVFDGLDDNGKHGRMVVVTGNRYQDAPVILAEMQGELDALYAAIFAAKATNAETPTRDYAPLSMDDNELLTRARNNRDAAKAARFIALYDRGDPLHYKSLSERDLALCNDLAYMCGPNAEHHVADLFRRSACYDRTKADREDYVARTVAKSYEGRTAFYQPRTPEVKESIDFEAPKALEENQLISDDGAEGEENELARLQRENARMHQQIAQIRAIINADGLQVAPLEKVLQIDFIVNAFVDEKHRNADGSTTIIIEARKDKETGKIKGKPGLADKHGMSRGSISKALENIEAFGTVRFGKSDEKKLRNGDVVVFNTVAPADRFAPKWERLGGPRKKMGGVRDGAGRKPKKKGEPCDELLADGTQCDGILTERRGVEATEHEFTETVCPNCGGMHGERSYTGKVATVTRYYTPEANQLNPSDDVSAWPDVAAAANHRNQNQGSVDASVHNFENLQRENQLIPPPDRPCIRCRAYDWRRDGEHWRCGSCQPTPAARAPGGYEMAVS